MRSCVVGLLLLAAPARAYEAISGSLLCQSRSVRLVIETNLEILDERGRIGAGFSDLAGALDGG